MKLAAGQFSSRLSSAAGAASSPREHPDMMSYISEGGGGSWKNGRCKGGCMNLIV